MENSSTICSYPTAVSSKVRWIIQALLTSLALGLILCATPVQAQNAPRAAMEPPNVTIDAPPVIAPPDSFWQMISNRVANPNRGRRWRSRNGDADQTAAAEDPATAQKRIDDELAIYRAFYKKYIDVEGMPVAAHSDVSDLALQRTYEIVTHMLAGRPDILNAMVSNNTYLIVIGKNQVYTDMPEYRNHPNPEYQNERVRGTGGNPTSFGEENLLSLPIDRYDDESIAVHEFCHTIDGTLRRIDPTWNERRNAAFQNADENKLYYRVYAGGNPGEYWAEIAQAYFDCNRTNNWNHGPVGNREQLKAHDPMGYALCESTFSLSPEQDWRYRWLQALPMVSAPPRTEQFKDIDPWYTKFTWAREFTVLGRGASDESLLKANDTIRKLFAYRHDILKALINDGVKLVVLGTNESLSNLPEIQKVGGSVEAESDARFLEYLPGPRLLVVGEESVLGNPATGQAEDYQLICVFAKAMYQVAGTRPVDPNWDDRGRDVQQYELHVKRLDVEFGQRLKQLYKAAMDAGLWTGTAAASDPTDYWATGVVAYFDAGGPLNTPRGAESPIRTRNALEQYDPGLFSLVAETMAYNGRQDWRFEPWSQ